MINNCLYCLCGVTVKIIPVDSVYLGKNNVLFLVLSVNNETIIPTINYIGHLCIKRSRTAVQLFMM